MIYRDRTLKSFMLSSRENTARQKFFINFPRLSNSKIIRRFLRKIHAQPVWPRTEISLPLLDFIFRSRNAKFPAISQEVRGKLECSEKKERSAAGDYHRAIPSRISSALSLRKIFPKNLLRRIMS